MSKREWCLFAEDICEAIERINLYTKGMTVETFAADIKTVDAVVRNLEVIGEATKYIPGEVKNRFPEVYWRGIIALRNRIAHEYFGLSIPIVWEIISNELSPVYDISKRMLAKGGT